MGIEGENSRDDRREADDRAAYEASTTPAERRSHRLTLVVMILAVVVGCVAIAEGLAYVFH